MDYQGLRAGVLSGVAAGIAALSLLLLCGAPCKARASGILPMAGAALAPDGGSARSLTLQELRFDTVKQEELTRFARGVFLARLGFGAPLDPPPWAAGIRRACFVTFFSGRRVVACSGGFIPRAPDLGREIEANVRQALHLDWRALRIDRKTALSARVLITFPGEPRSVASYQGVDPVRQGLFVENDRFGVAIVPGEAKTASWAFREALRRLGEKDAARVRLFVFDAWGIRSGRGNQ